MTCWISPCFCHDYQIDPEDKKCEKDCIKQDDCDNAADVRKTQSEELKVLFEASLTNILV
jgi:hypothetical protein